jgi:hypothetical protein
MTETLAPIVHRSLARLFGELAQGAAHDAAWILNKSDPGLLASLDKLSAREASELAPSGSSIAAHVDHLKYGLGLLIRWAEGEDPFADADYRGSWQRTTVTESQWEALRAELRTVAERWRAKLAVPGDLDEARMMGLLSSVAHLAYHLGAIRQIAPDSLRGPRARD